MGCGLEVETIQHILLECVCYSDSKILFYEQIRQIKPDLFVEIKDCDLMATLKVILGFTETKDRVLVCNLTKRHLERVCLKRKNFKSKVKIS